MSSGGNKNSKSFRVSLSKWTLWLEWMATALLYHFAPPAANACPSYVAMEDLLKVAAPVQRSAVRAFVAKPSVDGRVSGASQGWAEIAVDIQPMDGDGAFRFFPTEDWRHQPVTAFDRLIIDPTSFGPRVPFLPSDKASAAKIRPLPKFPGCTPTAGIEMLDTTSQQSAYIAFCQQPKAGPAVTQVTYNAGSFALQGPRYLYSFQETNHMLFRGIFLEPGAALAAQDARMTIHNDIRNFFNLNLGGNDLESYLEVYRNSPLGLVGRVKFYLKILFFKIKLSLSTDASFFSDSAHIPQILTIPERAEGRLNPGSGILYGWTLPVSSRIDLTETRMPTARPLLAKEGLEKVTEMALPYCSRTVCAFRVQVATKNQPIGMHFEIPRRLIDKGFFPQLIVDMKAFHRDATWMDGEDESNAGLYFETSGLASGSFGYDFWLRLGSQQGGCPRKAVIRRIF